MAADRGVGATGRSRPAKLFGHDGGHSHPVGVDHAAGTGADGGADSGAAAARVVQVLPERSGPDRLFDYLLPDPSTAPWVTGVRLGSRVRVPLGPRNVAGWVLGEGSERTSGRPLRTVLQSRGIGPSRAVVQLCRWAAWRWASGIRPFLAAASPTTIVRELPPAGASSAVPPAGPTGPAVSPTGPAVSPAGPADGLPGSEHELAAVLEEVWRLPAALVRLGPAADVVAWARELVARAVPDGDVMVLTPSVAVADRIEAALSRAGVEVARLPGGWAKAAAGGRVVLGSRAAAWAPLPRPALFVVVDVHDESWTETRAPTWSAVEVTLERAARSDARWVGLSPCPPVTLASRLRTVTTSRSFERSAWAPVEVVDLTRQDPRAGLMSERVSQLIRTGAAGLPVVLVYNRTGLARVLACGSCRSLVRCESCGAALRQSGATQESTLECVRCGLCRPGLCALCGSVNLRTVRPGTGRLAEHARALARTEVVEVTAKAVPSDCQRAGVVVGTEAALHRIERAAAVVFLDFDLELLSPYHGAWEAAMVLVARASRLTGGRHQLLDRAAPGRVVLQTRMPDHEVVLAAVRADPASLIGAEGGRRKEVRLPPYSALALVSGASAGEWLAALPRSIERTSPSEGRWVLRAVDHVTLCDGLASLGRPPTGTRVEVDPARV
ncbi:MAG: hypothetical protein M0Z87_05750 [Actinomycetota bacterium]|nr:hypothetical protein [Actinomycetota bacterium]